LPQPTHFLCAFTTSKPHAQRTILREAQNRLRNPQDSLQGDVNAGLPTHALRGYFRIPKALPSQFPNDRLSPKKLRGSHAHGGGYRPGISPGSLFTDRAQKQRGRHIRGNIEFPLIIFRNRFFVNIRLMHSYLFREPEQSLHQLCFTFLPLRGKLILIKTINRSGEFWQRLNSSLKGQKL